MAIVLDARVKPECLPPLLPMTWIACENYFRCQCKLVQFLSAVLDVIAEYEKAKHSFQNSKEKYLSESAAFKEREFFARSYRSVNSLSKENPMKKILLATTIMLMCGSAFAQNSTGPAPQSDNMNKPGMTNSGSGMNNNGMNSGTTGTGMQKEGMSKDGMSKDGMSKDGMKNDTMSKDGMKK